MFFSEIDECAENSDDCDRSVSDCTNTPGSFTCDCHSGYEMIVTTCTGNTGWRLKTNL